MQLHFEHALLPGGWQPNVLISVDNGVIVAVEPGGNAEHARRVRGIALPGMVNVHCHAFQRAMAGLAERRGPNDDSFWTWREVMYHFLAHLTPDDIEAIAAFAYAEMLEAGFTSVGEFHYIHHSSDGQPYANLAETSDRIVAAALETGIGLTLLPTFYRYGGFGRAEPTPGQRRFLNDTDRFMRLYDGAARSIQSMPAANIGVAPHSLRAVDPQSLGALLSALPRAPVHMHAAEQIKEVEDCVAWSGQRPIEWLLANANVDRRWCLIHATHMTAGETTGLARSGAVAGLCPLTEASLGDGIFNGAEFSMAGGKFCIGTDSQIEISAPGELKQLEYSQRLRLRARNVLALAPSQSTGRVLYGSAALAGAAALQQPVGTISIGRRADFVVLDLEHPDLAAVTGDRWLDAYIFVSGRSAVREVMVGGRTVVEGGRHISRSALETRYVKTLKRIASL